MNGGRTGTRTLDPLIKSQLLYRLSYAPPCRWTIRPGRRLGNRAGRLERYPAGRSSVSATGTLRKMAGDGVLPLLAGRLPRVDQLERNASATGRAARNGGHGRRWCSSARIPVTVSGTVHGADTCVTVVGGVKVSGLRQPRAVRGRIRPACEGSDAQLAPLQIADTMDWRCEVVVAYEIACASGRPDIFPDIVNVT